MPTQSMPATEAPADTAPAPELLAAAEAIRQGATRLARRLRTARSAGAMSTNKINVLSHLYRHGPSTPGEVAAADRQQPQSLTRVFAELERDGLVIRCSGAEDRRQSIISITEAGSAALRHDVAERDDWLAGALAGLSETERQVLRLAAGLMEHIADN
ncbi:MarR family winged helix-turn-helix transcriptional regulator [Catenulispora pinisilvae]|uniref:MarR family winged helix-turn-helix transcriptional regulator n=1 Tax=Catenulispora pinisilvae TaxID=2705253 RepID=UPI002B276D37|nr:MarR family transcriptional regulator [Catenulispora pinisilvae]